MNEQIPTPFTGSTTPARHDSGGLLRPLLWTLLVLGAVGNMVASAAAAGLVAHVVLGSVTAVAAAGLIALWSKARA